MRKIGIIGGLAWPSTIDYYRLLCEKTNDHFKLIGHDTPYPSPPIILESLNMAYTRTLRGREGEENSWKDFDDVFRTTLQRLKEAGADFGIIASNTPHMRLESIKNGLDFPIVSILETTAIKAKSLGASSALILGTSVTMKSGVYCKILKKHNIEANPQLPQESISRLDKIIDDDLYAGNIGSAREVTTNLCKQNISDPLNEIVCLACTELPLAFPEHKNSASFVEDGITYINTTVAHVDAVIEKMLVPKGI